MRSLRLLSVFGVALCLSACASKPKDLIIGKWEPTDSAEKGTLEFAKDGTMKMGTGPISIQAKYKFIDDQTMEVEMENPLGGLGAGAGGVQVQIPKTITSRVKVSVTKDELTTTDDKGKTTKFKRV